MSRGCPREMPGNPRDGPGWHQTQTRFSWGVLGWSWVALGMVLVLWGSHRVGPGKSKCCYFIDNTDVLGKRGFSLIFC